MNRRRYLSSGRTTLELIGVLAILGSVATGVYSMASNTMSERRTLDTMSKLHNLAITIQEAFSWTDSYVVSNASGTIYSGKGYTTITAYLTGEKILATKDLTLPSGDTVTLGSVAAVAATSTTAGTPSYFTISVTPDKYLCQAIAKEDWGNRLKQLKIGTTGYAYSATPLSLTAAVTACSAAPTIVLTFR